MARSMTVPPRTAQQHREISRLYSAFNPMMRQFDADMRREHQLSHAEYIALDWLSESPITLGLNGLGAALPAALSAISRTVGRVRAQVPTTSAFVSAPMRTNKYRRVEYGWLAVTVSA
jgi:hypothetical protein